MKSEQQQLLLWLAFAITACAFTIAAVHALRRMAPRVGLLDHPTHRKRHDGAVPLVGGLAMFTAFLLTCLAVGGFATAPWPFLVAAGIFVLMGSLDDRTPMSSRLRLVLQALVLGMVTIGGANVLDDLGPLLGPWPIALGLLAVPFTVFGLLGVLNALNFVDGADGLAGGIAFTALASFAAFAMLVDAGEEVAGRAASLAAMLSVLVGAVAGFLAFNLRTPWRRRASVFMGDAGSLFLGFSIGWVAIYACSQFGTSSLSPVTALWILMVPLFDTVSCMVRRRLNGRSPLRADRQHVHHLLQRAGLSPARAVAVLILVNAAGGVIGVTGWVLGVPDYLMFYALIALFAGWVVVSLRMWRQYGRAKVRPTRVAPVYPVGTVMLATGSRVDARDGARRGLGWRKVPVVGSAK